LEQNLVGYVTEMTKTEVPKFANEAEEAKWWFDHRDEVAAKMLAAAKNGQRGEGSVARYARKLRKAGVAELVETPTDR
jgi:hypothetical protein